MKDKAELAKYRIKDPTEQLFNSINVASEWYMISMKGNKCKVSISHELGETHLCASVILSEEVGRLPTYSELLKIKDIFFEEDENVVFGMSRNMFANYVITNPWAIHLYSYEGKMPPVEQVLKVKEEVKNDDFYIAEGTCDNWQFVRIRGKYYPDMKEIQRLKDKYASECDVAVFLVKGAVILFNNPVEGIKFHKQIIR